MKNKLNPILKVAALFLVLQLNIMAVEGPPQKVLAAFTKKFPNAQSVNWEKDGIRNWEAEFEIDDVGYSANFNSSGEWLETEMDINESDIPQAVLDGLSKDFPGVKILSSTKIWLKNNTIKFEMDIKANGKHREVEYLASGKKL